jgi:hypothetical protein
MKYARGVGVLGLATLVGLVCAKFQVGAAPAAGHDCRYSRHQSATWWTTGAGT